MIRFFDIFFSLLGGILLSPVFLCISLLIKISSKGPVFFVQKRVGKGNKDFNLFKFRTMHINADKMGFLTVGFDDPRITKFGYYLRKFKLDELPQLFNVLIGEMSFVGPRPEVRKYINKLGSDRDILLSVRPGITDWASLKYINENNILKISKNPESTYINEILPEKIKLNLTYINNKNTSHYFKIIFNTVLKIMNFK